MLGLGLSPVLLLCLWLLFVKGKGWCKIKVRYMVRLRVRVRVRLRVNIRVGI